MNFTNTDVHTRTWMTLHRENGATLSLGPGESADVFTYEDDRLVPLDAITDPYLVPAKPARKAPEPQASVPDPPKE